MILGGGGPWARRRSSAWIQAQTRASAASVTCMRTDASSFAVAVPR